jgi:hypothetical protein
MYKTRSGNSTKKAPIASAIAALPVVGSPLFIMLAASSEKNEATFSPDLEHHASV